MIASIFYTHFKETRESMESNGSNTFPNYLRILAVGCLDVAIMLPTGVLNLANITATIFERDPAATMTRFYRGWRATHEHFSPVSVPYTHKPWDSFDLYFPRISSSILALAIFILFGLNLESRRVYWQGICVIGRLFALKPIISFCSKLTDFRSRNTPQMSEFQAAEPINTRIDEERGYVFALYCLVHQI
jgi:hypothetical protein